MGIGPQTTNSTGNHFTACDMNERAPHQSFPVSLARPTHRNDVMGEHPTRHDRFVGRRKGAA